MDSNDPHSESSEKQFWARAKQIIDEALDLDGAERQTFLDGACAGDQTLREHVESLLAYDDDSFLEAQVSPEQQLRSGARLGPYEIDSLIGLGGMGEVYRATDTRLSRIVAIKVLPEHLAGSDSRRQRFEREARAISQLNHPYICTLHDVGNQDGVDYLVMEYIEGETLAELLGTGPLPIETALEYATQIASGLDRAHGSGIVHRDLKPGNVMLTRSGVKLLDFGLAKQVRGEILLAPGGAENQDVSGEEAGTVMTQQGMLLGTVPYMSPEQAVGRPVNHLSDQFSFGAVLYEMLTGEQPFRGDSAAATRERILSDTPIALDQLRSDVDPNLRAIIERCLQKEPEERYESTGDMLSALRKCQEKLTGRREMGVGRRPAMAGLAVLLVIVATSAWIWLRDDIVRWIERDTLAQVEQFVDSGRLNDAYRLISEIQDKIPGDKVLRGMLERFTLPIDVVTHPPGAQVLVSAYDSGDDNWLRLGETPLEGVRVPYALMRWKISKSGFETFEGAPFGSRPFSAFAEGIALDPQGSRPEGMVRIPGGPYQRLGFPQVMLDGYWLDTHEVSNREFKRFVDAGGYDETEYWADALAGETISREVLVKDLLDSSGAQGPAGWRGGAYDEGQADFPVAGVSWYEAAAYCHFVGKDLPTLFHWSAAAIQDQLSDIIPTSNFGGQRAAPVGSHAGLSDFGNYDMAGNVKEWVWNEASAGRYILGGSWSDPSYTYRVDSESSPPGSREPTHGFRCARYEGAIDGALRARFVHTFDKGVEKPASEEVFTAYRRMYAYDRSELDATVDKVDESSPHWRRETVSFAAAYGGERVIAHLFLPRNVEPPYQAVIWVPGNDAFLLPPGGALASPYLFDFIPRGGRALVYPVYKGTYERRIPFSFSPNEWRDLIVAWYKDLGRTVDYLSEREDFDTEKLAYYGFSAGAFFGPVFTAVDDRFKVSVILAGGLKGPFTPEVNPANFASRSHVPTLMINGREDFLNPLATSQLPLLNLLGAHDHDKRHARLEGGHIVSDRLALMEEVLGWMDIYLGPVN